MTTSKIYHLEKSTEQYRAHSKSFDVVIPIDAIHFNASSSWVNARHFRQLRKGDFSLSKEREKGGGRKFGGILTPSVLSDLRRDFFS